MMIIGICSGSSTSSTVSRSNWNLEVLIFVKGGKPENPEKNPRSKDENQQQTQPTYNAGSKNRTRATLVGSECSHHCAIPAPLPFLVQSALLGWFGELALLKQLRYKL